MKNYNNVKDGPIKDMQDMYDLCYKAMKERFEDPNYKGHKVVSVKPDDLEIQDLEDEHEPLDFL